MVKKVVLKILVILISSIGLGFLLLGIVYLLPVEYMEKNVLDSVNIFEEQGAYYSVIPNNESTNLDNFTDSIMLGNALYNGNEGIVEKIINVYRYSYGDETPVGSLIRLVNNDSKDMKVVSYDRYWHGYLVLLKPLLMLFDYGEIKLLNTLCQLLLVGYIGYKFIKNVQKKILLAYILAIVCIYPNVIALSLQFSTMFYIFNLGVAFILTKNDFCKKNNNYLYLFLILGIVTSYFDFLTYPLTSCAVPLLVYLMLNYGKSFWRNVVTIIGAGFLWSVGYIGMWASKWGVGSLVLRKNLISSAIDNVLVRTSNSVVEYNNRFSVIIDNFSYFGYLFIICLMILGIYILINWQIRGKIKFEKKNMTKYLPILFLGFLPFVWYVVTSNHSFVHSWFTYRNLVIFAFSLFSYLLLLFENKSN